MDWEIRLLYSHKKHSTNSDTRACCFEALRHGSLWLKIKVCHGYTAGTNFLNRTRTHQHHTHYGYGYILHRNFCGVKRVPIEFDERPCNNIENIFKKYKKNSNGGEGVRVAAAAAPATATPALSY